jgi:hypothetical protein
VSVSAVVRRWQLEEGELETRQPSLYSSRYVLDVCGPRARRVLRVVVERLVQVEGGQEVVVDLMAKTNRRWLVLGWGVTEIKDTYPRPITLCVLAARPMLRFDGHQLRDLAIPWSRQPSRDCKQHVADDI